MNVDVVMLTNTADDAIYRMTLRALGTLEESELDHRFNVILVETQSEEYLQERGFNYGSATVYPGGEFNYNRFLNAGFDHLSNTPFVVIANNDLLFHRYWFTHLVQAMSALHLDVGSPRSPGWPPHESFDVVGVHYGTRTSYEVAGWCFCIRRKALDAIRPFDERFRFEFQDVAMVRELISKGFGRMALVAVSRVTHLLNQSHRLIADRRGMIEGAVDIYRGKYGE